MNRSTDTKPRGERAVRKALLSAAVDAYNQGGFSVRKIAERAGVNHGQVHHYFGGLGPLKREVLEWLGDSLKRRVVELESRDPGHLTKSAVQVLLQDRRFARTLARQILDAPDLAAQDQPTLQGHFPVVRLLRENLGRDGAPKDDTALAIGLARALGWALFAPWICEALELDEHQRRAIEDALLDVDEPRHEHA